MSFRPYKDPLLITAQVLSVIGFCITIFLFHPLLLFWWPLISLFLVVFAGIACFCAMNKEGLITAGVLLTILGAIELCYFLIMWGMWGGGNVWWAILIVLAGLSKLVSGILVFVFACGKRYETAVARMREENDQSDHQPAGAVVTVGVRVTPTETNNESSDSPTNDDEIDVEAPQQK